MKKFAAVAVAIVILAMALLARNGVPGQVQGNFSIVAFVPQMLSVNAEIADSPEEITTGLMSRQSLGRNDGMLFVFPDSAPRAFWMKNTLIPLDMVFISEGLKVVKIHHAVPCTAEPCTIYHSEAPARYVLEVNANWTKTGGISEGNAVKIST